MLKLHVLLFLYFQTYFSCLMYFTNDVKEVEENHIISCKNIYVTEEVMTCRVY